MPNTSPTSVRDAAIADEIRRDADRAWRVLSLRLEGRAP